MIVGQKVAKTAGSLLSAVPVPDNKNIDMTSTRDRANDIVETLPYGVMSLGLHENGDVLVLSANALSRTLFSISDTQVFPCRLDDLWSAPENTVFADKVRVTAKKAIATSFEWTKLKDAQERFLTSHLQPLESSDGDYSDVLCTIEDQTAEKLTEKNIMHHAFHDALTGQPNRVLFRNKLEDAVLNAERDEDPSGCAVLVVNIDRFQQINESFGHSAGDRFLISMASTLRRCIDSGDVLARLSGDEFAILIPNMRSVEAVNEVCERIHKAMQQPYDLDGNEVFTSVSIGVATTISSATHPEDLIRDADFAMHRAKLAGKARTEIYQRESHQKARSQFHLETELRRAVEREDLQLYYQPIIDLNSSELHGFEALTRWYHKDHGYVSPVEFIQLAEETGVIVPLGRWAIDAACVCMKHWAMDVGEANIVPVNVNVSGVQFARDDVAAVVEDALERYDLPGHCLRIELTESSIMANPEPISKSLHRIRSLGVKVALDDFGTGYSSLNYLHQFPIDIIKIDRSFINQMQYDNAQYKILEMIGMLARNLGHEVVAEGLEDVEHINMVRDMGFEFGQGFFYSRPVAALDASDMVRGTLPWR